MRRASIMKIVVTALLTAIIFVQEELLSFIPNVQLTVFLIIIYASYCGMKWGSVIVIMHTLLDCLFMGSFVPQVILPMMVGWELLLLLGYIVRKRSVMTKAIISGIGAFIYCLCFMVVNVFVYKVGFTAYLIADIPFEVILIIVSFLSVLWLHNPLMKILKQHNVYGMLEEDEQE